MSISEIAIRVGSVPGEDVVNNILDGQVVDWVPQGTLFSGAEVVDYIENDVVPSGWSSLSSPEQKIAKRDLDRVKYLTRSSTNAQKAALKIYDVLSSDQDEKNEQLSVGQKWIDTGIYRYGILQVDGYHTTWQGLQYRRKFGVLLVDLTPKQLYGLKLEYVDEAKHAINRQTTYRAQYYRIPYESFVAPATIALWEDDSVAVNAIDNSGAPFAWSDLSPEVCP